MDNFEIICKLGSGGFSKVYKVKRKIDNQIYALKKVQILNLSEKQKLSSLNEIRVLASIKNKYIINYKEAFLDEKDCTLCLVMEYADKGDLEKRIKEQKEKGKYFNEKDIWKVFIQIVNGLKSLHDQGIMHRDIKSSNIFLFSNGMAKIGDLNVCKILSNDNLGHTQAGTPAYAAPEVWMEKPYGLKSDIWSLGCVLYEMITLKCPFREDNMMKLYNKILVGEYKKIPNKFSEELNWIVGKMINSEINKRFSCEEILNCEYIQKRIEQNDNNYNIKSYSEKKINECIIKNYKNKINYNLNNSLYKHINKKEENKEDDNGTQLLKTIHMPNNFLYLKDELPRANYNNKMKSNSINKDNESTQLNSELTSSASISIKDNNRESFLLKLKRNSYQSISYQKQKREINKLLNAKRIKEGIGQIKLKHINSTLISNERNDLPSLENNENICYQYENKLISRKSETNLNKKLKDFFYIYEKEKENNMKIEKNNIKDSKFINNDKIKIILNSKIKNQNQGNGKDFQFILKANKDINNIIENNRYNNNDNNNRYNNNDNNHNEYNEIVNDIINNKNNKNIVRYNNIFNKNISYINNSNNLFHNINNYKYKNENEFVNRHKNKKSIEILPKIKLSYV